jgi:hypothetical protein
MVWWLLSVKIITRIEVFESFGKRSCGRAQAAPEIYRKELEKSINKGGGQQKRDCPRPHRGLSQAFASLSHSSCKKPKTQTFVALATMVASNP